MPRYNVEIENGQKVLVDYSKPPVLDASEVSYGNSTVDAELDDIKSTISKHLLTSGVSLTDNTDYTCQSDGCFRIFANYSSNDSCVGYIDGVPMMSIRNATTGGNNGPNYSSIFVRKGTVIKVSGTGTFSGIFYPLG